MSRRKWVPRCPGDSATLQTARDAADLCGPAGVRWSFARCRGARARATSRSTRMTSGGQASPRRVDTPSWAETTSGERRNAESRVLSGYAALGGGVSGRCDAPDGTRSTAQTSEDVSTRVSRGRSGTVKLSEVPCTAMRGDSGTPHDPLMRGAGRSSCVRCATAELFGARRWHAGRPGFRLEAWHVGHEHACVAARVAQRHSRELAWARRASSGASRMAPDRATAGSTAATFATRAVVFPFGTSASGA